MPSFLASGHVLINPAEVRYAVVEVDSEGLHLRVAFGSSVAGNGANELRLSGLEARSLLNWLRSDAHFLDSGGTSSACQVELAVSPATKPERQRVFFRERVQLRAAVGA